MPDMQGLHNKKEKIMSIIKLKGPSFPARISRETGLSSLFVSAFLSELVSEKRLKISNLKLGSSPLYFLEGQEAELENFVEHMNSKEKEAFIALKENEVLEDEKLSPQIRVALRSLKDFAHPINVKIGEETKLFWRHFLFPQNQIKEKIQKTIFKKEEQREETKKEERTKEKPKQRKIQKPSEFANNIKEYLSAKDIELLTIFSEKKKEFIGKIRLDTNFGKQEYYLISKDKKKISTNDLTIALQQAQTQKMPSLVLSPGELDKKAQEYAKEWRNLIKFERIKI